MDGNNEIYLDYAANTPVDSEVLSTFVSTTQKYYANPNSSHSLGKKANAVINESTSSILNLFKAHTKISEDMDIIYTSGASESNNLSLKGIARAYRNTGKHIISTFLEHSSVSSPLTALKEQGYEIDLLEIDESGKVNLESLKECIRQDTILVSVCYVDSELGSIQPIKQIADIVKKYPNCFLHVDCTQAIGKIDVDLRGVDLISFTPHKFYGLNGFGGLLKRKDIVLEPLIHGGASTSIYRSGTPVVGQIASMEKALKLAFDNVQTRYNYVKNLNEKLRARLEQYDLVQINTPNTENPFILNLGVKGVKATDFKAELEKYGVCISIKSACSVTISPSKPVFAITHDRKRALSSWRISLSHLVNPEEIDEFLDIFDKCYVFGTCPQKHPKQLKGKLQ